MRSLGYVLGPVALLLLVGGAPACKKSASKWSLPLDAKQLPGQTTELEAEVIDGTRETDPHVRQMYTNAELGSEICRAGSADPALELEGLGTSGASAARQFFKQANLDAMQSLLECGALLTANLDSNFQTAVGFTDDSNTKQAVGILKLKAQDIPPKFGLTKHAFSGLDGFCRSSDPLKPNAPPMDCTPASEAALHQGSTWFFGKRGALDTVGKSVTTPRAELSTLVAALNDAAAATEGLSSARIKSEINGSAKGFLAAPCAWGGLQSAGSTTDFVSACFPSTDDKVIEGIDAKLRAAAFEIEPDVLKAGGVHGNIVLVARDNDAAKEVEKDANDLVTDWKSQLGNNEAKMIKQAKNDPITLRQKNWAILVDNFIHALEAMKVTRDGRAVRIGFNAPLDPSDKSELDDADKQTKDRRIAVADVLDAIATKKPLPKDALSKLIGAPWAAYIAQSAQADVAPLTAAQCKDVKKSASKVKVKDLPNKDATAFLGEVQRADCNHPPQMTASTRSCLTAFQSAADFAKCAPAVEPPDGQFGLVAKK